MQEGDYQRAQALLEQSRQIVEALHEQRDVASVLQQLGEVASAQGAWQQAEDYFRASIDLSQKSAMTLDIAKCLHRWAMMFLAKGQAEQAARYASLAHTLLGHKGIAPQALIAVQLDDLKRAIQMVLGAGAFQVAWEQGKMLSLDELLMNTMEGSLMISTLEVHSNITSISDSQ